jgi:F-type H+-transporting ATPase subunit delta
VSSSPVARVYTEALFEIAQSRSVVEETRRELEDIQAMFEHDPRIVQFFSSPIVEPEAKLETLRRSLQNAVSDLVIDFLSLLLEKERFAALPAIVQSYREMADVDAGRVRVHIATAQPLGEAMRQEINNAITRGLRREVVLEDETEPALVGGAVVTIGDKVYDGSLSTRLNQIRKQIMRSSGYEDQG